MSKTAPKFEATFTNLDLSEFSSASSSSTALHVASASAQLIQIKKQEAERRQREEEEEALMQNKSALRAQRNLQQLQTLEKKKEECGATGSGKGTGDNFYGALLSMHGNDHAGGKKEKSGAKTKAQRRTKFGASTGNGGVVLKHKASNSSRNSKKGVVKKSRRSKH